DAIKGFLLALRDCCIAKGAGVGAPDFLATELAKRGGLDAEDTEKARIERKFKRLIQELKYPDAEDRADAAGELGNMFQAANLLYRRSANRTQVDNTVNKMFEDMFVQTYRMSKRAVLALTGALKDKDYKVRLSVCYALAKIGTDAKAAVPDLVNILKDDQDTQYGAAYAIAGIGPDAKAAVPALIELLSAQDKHNREIAADALGSIGPEARAAIAALNEALRDEDERVRNKVAEALERIAQSPVPESSIAFEDRGR